MLLATVGRHFALAHNTLLVVGRSEQENVQLSQMSQRGDVQLELAGQTGPLSILRGPSTPEICKTAAAITVRYSRFREEKQVRVTLRTQGTSGEEELIVDPIADHLLEGPRIV